MLSCGGGKRLRVEAAWALLEPGAEWTDEAVGGGVGSLCSRGRGRGRDSATEMSVCLLFSEAREGPDEVDDA